MFDRTFVVKITQTERELIMAALDQLNTVEESDEIEALLEAFRNLKG